MLLSPTNASSYSLSAKHLPQRLNMGRLTSRLGNHYTFRGHQFSLKFPLAHDDEDDDRHEESDRESSYMSRSSDSSCASRASSPKNFDDIRPPRVVLLDLPIEIIELIAVSMRDPAYPGLDAAALYIADRWTDFSTSRFPLSAFSMVCSSIRRTVERILYRNIQLDFTGWKGRKHPKWPAGSLLLILRTLEERPDLGRYIHTAALDYQLSKESGALEKGLEQFLSFCPNLGTLLLAQCPLALWDFPLLKNSTLATTFAPGILPSILEQFPKLQNLHLRDCHIMGFNLDLPPHKLQRLRLDSSHQNAVAHFARALSLCWDTVHSLDIRFIGGLLLPTPSFSARAPSLPPQAGMNIRTLRLDNISVLSNVTTGYLQLLRDLPSLQHLHVSHHNSFAPSAFSTLPLSLRTLTTSNYYGIWGRGDGDEDEYSFMTALANCIESHERQIARVDACVGYQVAVEFMSLDAVILACQREKIKYTEMDESDGYVRIFFS